MKTIQVLRAITRFCAGAVLIISLGSVQADSLPPPLRTIAKFAEFRPADYPIISYEGRLLFSQYDNSGNNFDVIAFDIANQSTEYVLRGRYGARFIAQNDKYLVVTEKGWFAKPLVVINRSTGARIKQIKLRHDISWATIEGDRLVAIQSAALGGGNATHAEALVFELPSLKVIKSTVIIGGNDAQIWNGNILSLGYELAGYDFDFNQDFKISLPTRKRGDRFSCALTGPMRIYENKAVIIANCGEILIYDLPTRRLERTIPSYAHFYAVTIIDGLIFTTPTSMPESKDGSRVFDLYTGKELAVLPITATHLFAKGDRLLAVEREYAKPSPMTLYSVDISALRSEKWRTAHALTECEKGALLLSSSDVYGAIGLCKSAGIEGLVKEARNSNEIFSAVKQYAFWLSKTYDRSRDAIAILEELQDIAPDQEITRALAEVRLKARVLEGGELGSITTDEQQTDFAQALDAGNKRIHAEAKNIDFGAFSNLFHFSGNRIYVGRYGCNGCSDNGASISVLDRDTFEQAASIPVAPDDSDFQDAIRSIASDNDRIYASIEYRYEEAGRPNFVVIDKASHKILKKAQIDAPSSLIVENGALMACRCSSMSSFEQSCKVLDPITTKVIDAPDKICVHSSKIDGDAIIQFPIDEANTNLFVALTKDYVIAHRDWPEKKSRYTLFTRATHSQAAPVELNLQDSLDWPIAISGNSILISGATRDGMLIKLVSIPTGATKTLLGLPTTRSPIPVPLLLNQILFVGLGRDLMVFDVKNNRLQRYIKNFIPAPFKDNGNGLDANRIDRLLVDRGRLIAITFHGENSQVVPISELVASGE